MRFLFRLLFTILLGAAFFLPTEARALTLSPVKFFVTIDPGATERLILNIRNDDKQGRLFKFSVAGLRQDENGRPVFFSNIDEAEKWVRPELPKMTLAGGASGQAVFVIKVPLNVVAAAHHLGLVVEESASSDGGVGLSSQAVAIVTLQTAGSAQEKVDIEKWRQRAGNFWDSERIFELSFSNAGNIDVSVVARLSVKDFFGKEVASRDFIDKKDVLAGSRRFVESKVVLPRLWPGWYEARVDMIYGRTRQHITGVVRILYFPKWIILFIAIILFLFVFFGYKRTHKNIDNSDAPRL